MSMLKWLLVVVLLAIAVLAWWLSGNPPTPTSTQTVALEMEILGGFAYINEPTQGRFNIAFLKDTGTPGAGGAQCVVDQQGHDLRVVSGDIIEPAQPPANRTFDLAGATVTFPGTDTSAQTLQVYRGARPNGLPQFPEQDTEWEDMKWIPAISAVEQSWEPPSKLDPNWPNIVDGRVVLTRGVVQAAHPSDFVLRRTTFEFKASSTASDSSKNFTHALTDRVMWNVDVPGTEVVIEFQNAASGVSRIVVRPRGANRKVRLKLLGRHGQGVPPVLSEGTELTHFCAFYDLFTPKPAFDNQIRPYVKQLPPPGPGGSGSPSPGALCPGIWPAP
jgi:hypothetical protein